MRGVLMNLRAALTVWDTQMVHGDLKPTNGLFAPDSFLLIHKVLLDLDFNVQPVDIDPSMVHVTDYGLIYYSAIQDTRRPGTFPYMAPEVRETGSLSANSDIWSLGFMGYELALGYRVHCDSGEAFDGGWARVRADHGSSVEQILMACLQRHPEIRYTFEQLEAALGAAIQF